MFVPGTARTTIGLAVTQTIGYGTLFYSFTILSAEFGREFGWTQSFVFGVFSAGLLASGLAAPFVGNLLDRIGARRPMTLGSVLAAAGLVAMGLTSGSASFAAAAVATQLFSALVLYEAAFVAETQAAGVRARLGITQITLVAGFASTVFWPFIVWMLAHLDWREVYFVLAAMNFLLCAPLHWFALRPKSVGAEQAARQEDGAGASERRVSVPRHAMILLGICFCGGAVAITATQLHLLSILDRLGFDAAAAATLGALIGPFQVGARVAEIVFGRRRTPMFTGLVSTILLALGLSCLLAGTVSNTAAFAFAVFYGMGQGLTYIVRGAVPLHLFGPAGYGRITGKLNSARLIASATSPFGFAWVAENWGGTTSLLLLVASAGLATIALIVLVVQAKH